MKVQIFYVSIKQLKPKQVDLFYTLMSESKKQKIKSYRFKDDSLRSLLGETLVKYAVSKKMNCDMDQILIDYDENNKPYLKSIPIYFNIAHCNEYVVCAIATKPIGVDLEQVRGVHYEPILNKFTNHEKQMILQTRKELRLDTFFQLWTIKESFMKLDGRGIKIPLDQFDVLLETKTIQTMDETVYYDSLHLEDYWVSMSMYERFEIEEINEVNVLDICREKKI